MHSAAHEDVLILGQIEVELGDVGVEGAGRGRGEGVTHKVETISDCGRVGLGVLIKESLYIGVRAATGGRCPGAVSLSRGKRVHAGQLRRSQSLDLISDWTWRSVGGRAIEVLHDARAQIGAGHNPGDLGVFPGALTFVGQKEEHAIFADGTANRCAEGIADQLAGNIGQAGFQLRLLVEPVVGIAEVGAVVFVSRPVERIGSTFGD